MGRRRSGSGDARRDTAGVRTTGGSWAWRAVVAWFLFIVAESVHGVVRGLWIEPWLGAEVAQRIGFAVGSLIVLAVAWGTVRWIGARTTRSWLAVGLLWAALTFGFEVLLGRLGRGWTWARILADYDPSAGGFMGLALGLLVLAPGLAARARGLRPTGAPAGAVSPPEPAP